MSALAPVLAPVPARSCIGPVPDHRPPPVALATLPPLSPRAEPLPLLDVTAATVQSDADPAAAQAVLILVRAACDVATGRRTASQLGRWCREPALSALTAWAHAQHGRPRTLRSLRAQQPNDDVVEACVRLTDPQGRSIALALRCERLPSGAWCCTAADPGPISRGDAQVRGGRLERRAGLQPGAGQGRRSGQPRRV